jgi:hypothetical protein
MFVIIFSWQNPSTGLIVLSGCGTSGRIGFITAVSIVDKFIWSFILNDNHLCNNLNESQLLN